MSEGSVEVLALRAQCQDLMDRVARLQGWADERGEHVVNEVASGVVDASSAAHALDRYDAEWFASLVYSPALVRRIADRLAQAVRPYPFLDAAYLRDVARPGAVE